MMHRYKIYYTIIETLQLHYSRGGACDGFVLLRGHQACDSLLGDGVSHNELVFAYKLNCKPLKRKYGVYLLQTLSCSCLRRREESAI